MSFVKIYIHSVWSTKNRLPLLRTPELRQDLWCHIQENASKKGILMDSVGGYHDHCHCVISLGVQQMFSNIMQLIKGEASHWINKNNLGNGHFEWQDDYYAVSVSPDGLNVIRKYIRRQEDHHTHRSFQEEIDDYFAEWGFERFADGSVRSRP